MVKKNGGFSDSGQWLVSNFACRWLLSDTAGQWLCLVNKPWVTVGVSAFAQPQLARSAVCVTMSVCERSR